MGTLTRRSVLRGSIGAAAAAATVRASCPAFSASGKTLTMWWNQGFYAAEDAAFKKLVADWEKQSGNTVELTLYPGEALNQRIVAALTSGDVPDLLYADNGPQQIVPQNAWAGKLLDVSDVVETQKAAYSPTALLASQYYDNTIHKRSFYGVPFKASVLGINVWRPLVEKAGYKMSDIPKTWDAYFKFFEPMQTKLRSSMRGVYALGYTVSTTGDDPNNLYNAFLVAYGGLDIVTQDGKLHLDDPKIKNAAIEALTALAVPYKEGFVPPGAINWGDPDNNNAFHSQQVIMTPNDTISIPVAVMSNKKEYFDEIATNPIPLGNDGKPVPSQVGIQVAFIPKGSKNVDTAKEFLKYLIQPKVVGEYLRNAQGRWLPVMPQIVKDDPYWLDPKDPHRPVSVRQGVLGPTVPWFYVFNPAYAQVNAEHIWSVAEADIMINNMAPDKAAAKAFERIEAIFAKYPIVQS